MKPKTSGRPIDIVMTINDEDDCFEGMVHEDDVVETEKAPPRPVSNAASFKDVGKKRSASSRSEGGVMNAKFQFDDLSTPSVTTEIWDFTSTRAALRSENKPQYTSIDEIIRKNMSEKRADDSDVEEEALPEEHNSETDSNSDGTVSDGGDDFSQLADRVRRQDGIQITGSDDEASEEDAAEAQRKAEYFAPAEDSMHLEQSSFANMNLSRPILRALTQVGFTQPTLIQAKAIPVALLGRDVCGGAVTGSGKTAAFIVPIIERLLYRPRQEPMTRVLILCPTRELAIQCHSVATKLASFTDIRFCLCVGGLGLKSQEAELRLRPDVVIATPGRLIDHLRNSRALSLHELDILVMDEADRMLEDGFKDELTEIVRQCPHKRQTMLFSATMTDNVDELIRLSLNKPVRLLVDSTKATAEGLTQEFIRIRGHRENDRTAYLIALCSRTFRTRCIVFFRSKAAAHNMKITFGLLGLKAAEIHGNLSQEQRLAALEDFRDGRVDFMMATDLAARGLDIKGIDTVVNYKMPTTYTQYLHRIGRTARAGRAGRSISLAGEDDRKVLKQAIKNSPARLIQHRVIPAEVLEKCCQKARDLQPRMEQVLEDEKEDRVMRQAEMELRKGQNVMKYKDEIASRPARTWFISQSEKKTGRSVAIAGDPAAKKAAEGKRQLSTTAGMSRKKRRRFEHAEEDRAAQKETMAAVRSAKRAKQATKMTTERPMAAQKPKNGSGGFGSDLADAGNCGAGPKSAAARARNLVKAKQEKLQKKKSAGGIKGKQGTSKRRR